MQTVAVELNDEVEAGAIGLVLVVTLEPGRRVAPDILADVMPATAARRLHTPHSHDVAAVTKLVRRPQVGDRFEVSTVVVVGRVDVHQRGPPVSALHDRGLSTHRVGGSCSWSGRGCGCWADHGFYACN